MILLNDGLVSRTTNCLRCLTSLAESTSFCTIPTGPGSIYERNRNKQNCDAVLEKREETRTWPDLIASLFRFDWRPSKSRMAESKQLNNWCSNKKLKLDRARIGLMLILNRILSHPSKTFFHGAGSMFVTIKSSKVNSSTNCSYLFDPHERTLNNVSIVALTTLIWTELFHPLTRRAYRKKLLSVSNILLEIFFFICFL